MHGIRGEVAPFGARRRITRHAAIADKLARMTSTTYAVEAMSLLTSSLVDRGNADIRLEAAMCKMFGTEKAWHIVDETMQTRGGRGFETRPTHLLIPEGKC